jgi:outer membrane receptor protein involved in Fe transport
VQKLTANGGYRSSDYDLDGVGRVETYLYGLDWRVNDSVAFRGQFQRAIRAPNIGDLYGGLQLNFQTLNDPCSSRNTANQTAAVRALCVATGVPTASVFTAGVQPDNIIPTRSGGNVNLQEETSDTTTLGVVFSPTFLDNLVVTLDYFDIKLDGAIAQLGGGAQNTLNLCYLTVQDASSDFCQAVHRNPASGSITVPYSLDVLQANIGRLATIGYDLGARYGWDVGFGMEAAAASTSRRSGPTPTSSRSRPCRPCRRTKTVVWARMARPAVSRFPSTRVLRDSAGPQVRWREPPTSLIDSVTTTARAAEDAGLTPPLRRR